MCICFASGNDIACPMMYRYCAFGDYSMFQGLLIRWSFTCISSCVWLYPSLLAQNTQKSSPEKSEGSHRNLQHDPRSTGLTPSPEYPIVATYGKGSAGKVFNFWWKGEKCVGTLHPCESRFGKNTNLKWISGSPPFISPWSEQTASLHLKCMRGEDEHFPLGW